MSKYDRLGDYLRERGMGQIRMTFAEIERVVGTKLPKSQKHPAWWSNSTSNNVMTKVWLDAGYETAQVDVVGQTLLFRRIGENFSYGGGMSETAREFKLAESAGEKKQNRHPALGAMKGTFTIEPGYDLTSPIYTDEEWAEIEKEMSDDWDQIEQGMSGGKK
jgi:hypothetical protein